MRKLLSLFAVVVVCLGCGGTDANGTDAAKNFMQRYANAMESGNPDLVDNLFSTRYLNDCDTRSQFVND